MIAGIVVGCYAVAWLFAARLLYGRWRGTLMQLGSFDRYCSKCHTLTYSLASDRETVIRTCVAALVWPVTLLIFAVVFRPPPTAAERAAENAKLTKRIAELERETGIKP